MRPLCLSVAAVLSTLLVACASGPSAPIVRSTAPTRAEPAPSAPAASPATKAAATRANLAIEKLRLAELFRGTPVLFALQPDGSLRAEVPMRYSFDAGKAAVKAPLAAVLDHMATGQLTEITQLVVSAPGDAGAKNPALVAQRAANARDHLIGRGLPEGRVLVSSGPASGGVLRIVVGEAPAP